MARLNIEDDFWTDILDVAIAMGNKKLAVGEAVIWFRFAQSKHKQGKLISEDEFKAEGFSESLFPSFATRTELGIKAKGAEKHFDWLKSKVEAGRKGGQVSSPAKVQAARINAIKQNQAKPSESEQNQPSSSSSSSSSSSDSSSKNKDKRVDFKSTPMPRIAQLWNEHCGNLPKVQACGGTRRKHAMARWNEKDNELYWISVIGKIRDSDFCSGRNNRGWRANFDFLVKPETHNKVLEGQYENKNSATNSANETERIVRMLTDATA